MSAYSIRRITVDGKHRYQLRHEGKPIALIDDPAWAAAIHAALDAMALGTRLAESIGKLMGKARAAVADGSNRIDEVSSWFREVVDVAKELEERLLLLSLVSEKPEPEAPRDERTLQ